MVTAAIPLFGRDLGASFSLVGLILATGGFTKLAMEVPTGFLSDRFGGKPLMSGGMATLLVSALIAALAQNPYHLILSRLVGGAGEGLIYTSGWIILLAEIAPADKRARYTSYYVLSTHAGSALGKFVGGLVGDMYGLRIPFFIQFGTMLGCLFLIHFTISEELIRRDTHATSKTELLEAAKKFFMNKRVVLAGCVPILVAFILIGLNDTAVPLYGEERGLSVAEIGSVLSIGEVAYLLILVWSGSMADKFGRTKSLIFGFILSAASGYAFTFTDEFSSISIAQALLMISFAIIDPAYMPFLLDISGSQRSGTQIGFYRCFWDIGSIISPVLLGLLFEDFGISSPFLFVGTLCLGAAVVLASVNHFKLI